MWFGLLCCMVVRLVMFVVWLNVLLYRWKLLVCWCDWCVLVFMLFVSWLMSVIWLWWLVFRVRVSCWMMCVVLLNFLFCVVC